MLRPEEEVAPGNPLPANFETAEGKRYFVGEPESVYRRLGVLGPQPVLVSERLDTVKSNEEVPLVLLFNVASEGTYAERDAQRIAIRYSKMLGERAAQRAVEATMHFFEEPHRRKLLVVFDGVFVEQPYNALPAIGVFLSKDVDDNSAQLVENAAPWPQQPHNVGLFPLPGTGGYRHLLSCRSDGVRLAGLTFEALAPLCQPRVRAARREGEYRDRPVIRPFNNFSRGLALSVAFKNVARRITSARIAGGDGSDAGGMSADLQAEAAHQEYLQRLRNTMEGVIDVSDTRHVWAPNERSMLGAQLIRLIQDDLKNDLHPMMFTSARGFLNTLFARAAPPGDKIWYKAPSRSHENLCASLAETSAAALLKNSGINIRLTAPDDPEVAFKTLHGQVKIGSEDGKFDFMEWYVRFGMREVQCPRFWPLAWNESLTDAHHRGFVNTFSGFACHAWLRNESERRESERIYRQMKSRDAAATDPRPLSARQVELGKTRGEPSSLHFFLDHLRHLCSDDEETLKMLTNWLALLALHPAMKPPTCFIFKGPPGVGKTSATVAFAVRMLSPAHMRKVTQMEHLVGHFNADAENSVITIIEEMDFKDQKAKALNALQGTAFRTERRWALACGYPPRS